MKALKKIIIFLIVVIAILGISYIAYNNGGIKPVSSNNMVNENAINNSTQVNNNTSKNETTNTNNEEAENQEDEEYIGKEEQDSQTNQDNKEKEEEDNKNDENEELTAEEKAVDIVTKQYALNGETVRFDHMEDGDYIIKINNGTAVTWYIVDGETWEAEEY